MYVFPHPKVERASRPNGRSRQADASETADSKLGRVGIRPLAHGHLPAVGSLPGFLSPAPHQQRRRSGDSCGAGKPRVQSPGASRQTAAWALDPPWVGWHVPDETPRRAGPGGRPIGPVAGGQPQHAAKRSTARGQKFTRRISFARVIVTIIRRSAISPLQNSREPSSQRAIGSATPSGSADRPLLRRRSCANLKPRL
jgi:hypothetical protein